jgi:hypothetical protein
MLQAGRREIGLSEEVAPAHATLEMRHAFGCSLSKQGAERKRKLALRSRTLFALTPNASRARRRVGVGMGLRPEFWLQGQWDHYS